MGVIETRTFKSGNSVALRLPKELGYSADEVVLIDARGKDLHITPKPKLMPRELVERLRQLPRPKLVQKREPIIFPERRGL